MDCLLFCLSLLPGLDWIERENFLDVHLTRNRPPPARRRRSGPSQRTSYRRAGQAHHCTWNEKHTSKLYYIKLCLKNWTGKMWMLVLSFYQIMEWLWSHHAVTPDKYFLWKLHFFTSFRLAIAQPAPSAVPAEHISGRLARAGGVPSLLLWAGVRVGLHGRPIPWRNLWGLNHAFILQLGERHTPHCWGETYCLLKAAAHATQYCVKEYIVMVYLRIIVLTRNHMIHLMSTLIGWRRTQSDGEVRAVQHLYPAVQQPH